MGKIQNKVKSPKILMGFELEGGWGKNEYCDNTSAFQFTAKTQFFKKIKPLLQKIYKNKLQFVDDGSIDIEYPIEIVTPPLPVDQAKENLFQLIKKLRENNFVTNRTCGFHVNISVPEICKNKDDNKRIHFGYQFANKFNVQKWRAKFRRTTNEYCHDFRKPKSVNEFDFDRWIGKECALYMKLGSSYEFYKPEQRRIEIRIGGNTNYHKKEKMIQSYLNEIESATKKAISYIKN